MQTLTAAESRRGLAFVLGMGILAAGCGWQKTASFPSPSRRAAIEIWQTRFANEWGTQVALVTGERKRIIFENRREAVVYFVHVYWAADESIVGVLATGGNIWSIAYDLRAMKPVSFESIRADVARSIAATYSIPTGMDPVSWAASSDAQSAFFRHHPEVRFTYH